MPRPKTAKTALAEAYEHELKKLEAIDAPAEDEDNIDEELDFTNQDYTRITDEETY